MSHKNAIEIYTEGCIAFANDTAEWGGLDPYQQYTVTAHNWHESCDGSPGGIYCDWAFHKPEDYIRQNAPTHYLDHLTQAISNCVWENDPAEIRRLIDFTLQEFFLA